MTPQWAAANPNAGDPRWGAGTASPPRDINDWKAYFTSVALRLRAYMRRFVDPFLAALNTRGYPFDGFAIHTYPAGKPGPQDRVNDIVYWQSTVANSVGAASPVLDRLTFDTEVNFGVAGPGATPGRAYSDAEGASIIQQTYPAVLGTPSNDFISQRADDMRDMYFWKQAGEESGMKQASFLNTKVSVRSLVPIWVRLQM